MLGCDGREVNSVVFSPDGRLLASATLGPFARPRSYACRRLGGTIQLWDIATEAYMPMLEKHSSYVNSVTFSPNGQLLASASGAIIKLWDLATGAYIRTLEMKHNPCISYLIFH